jgi:hypothetical protein
MYQQQQQPQYFQPMPTIVQAPTPLPQSMTMNFLPGMMQPAMQVVQPMPLMSTIPVHPMALQSLAFHIQHPQPLLKPSLLACQSSFAYIQPTFNGSSISPELFSTTSSGVTPSVHTVSESSAGPGHQM